MVSFNAGPSWSSVVMSLKMMPFCGKSGTSLMRLARSITAPPGSAAGEFYRPERCACGGPTPGSRWGLPGLQDAGDPEPDNGDQLVGVPAAVAPPPQVAELLQRVIALLAGVDLGHLAEALADHVGD